MRKLAILAALASTTLATPALAVDNAWYVGVEGGAMIAEDTNFDLNIDHSKFDNAIQQTMVEVEVVRHNHERHVALAAQTHEQGFEFRAPARVEPRERLVEHERARPGGQHAREHHAAELSAAEFVGAPRTDDIGVETDRG